MSGEYLIEQMDYFLCPKDAHGQEMSMICLEKKCHKGLLICPICEVEAHEGHQILPLRTYLNQSFRNDGNIGPLVLQKIQTVEKMKQSVKEHIDNLRQSFLNQLYLVETKMVEYFNEVSQRLFELSEVSSRKHLRKVLQKVDQDKSLEQFKKILESIRVHGRTPKGEIFNHYTTLSEAKIQMFKNHFQEMKLKEHFEKIKELFAPLKNFCLKSNWTWGPHKAQKITINELTATQTSSSSSGQRFALMSSNQKYGGEIVVGIKIKKLKGWIGLGICLQNAIVKGCYKFNYTQTYHGSYLVSSNGYSWSHSQPQHNSHQNGFSFVEGDVIKVTLNNTSKLVIFENMKKSAIFKLQILDAPINDFYVPCVNMCNPGDEVQIVNDIN